eukprot:1161835-Pelagomonas_calceolata.AAC.10
MEPAAWQVCVTLQGVAQDASPKTVRATPQVAQDEHQPLVLSVGCDSVGKSTLMRAIAANKVEGFPPPDQLRTVYVEHDIQTCTQMEMPSAQGPQHRVALDERFASHLTVVAMLDKAVISEHCFVLSCFGSLGRIKLNGRCGCLIRCSDSSRASKPTKQIPLTPPHHFHGKSHPRPSPLPHLALISFSTKCNMQCACWQQMSAREGS